MNWEWILGRKFIFKKSSTDVLKNVTIIKKSGGFIVVRVIGKEIPYKMKLQNWKIYFSEADVTDLRAAIQGLPDLDCKRCLTQQPVE